MNSTKEPLTQSAKSTNSNNLSQGPSWCVMLEELLSSSAWEWDCLVKPSLPPSSQSPAPPGHPPP